MVKVYSAIRKAEWENFRHNIIYIRKQNRLTQHAMARLLGISPQTLGRIERSELPPQLGTDILVATANRFEIPLTDLLLRHLDDREP